MGDFYGMKPGTIPGFAEAGSGKFIGVEGLPGRTVTNMVAFMQKLRRMHEDDPLTGDRHELRRPCHRPHPHADHTSAAGYC